MRWLSRLLFLGLAALVAGCAATGPTYSDLGTKMPAVAPDQARVIIYRDSMLGAMLRPEVRIDGRVIGPMKPNSFLSADVTPGPHVASTSTETDANLDFTARAGETTYLRMSIGLGLVVGRPHLELRQAAEATQALATLGYAGTQPLAGAAVPQVPQAPQAATPADAARILPAPATAPAAVANTFEYLHTDREVQATRTVTYHVDRRVGQRLVLNGGSRVEEVGGRVLSDTGLVGGEFDLAMPPGGWVHPALLQQGSWEMQYSRTGTNGKLLKLQVQARKLGESTLRVQGRDLRVVEVLFTGYTERGSAANMAMPGRYTAHAWYAPELGRIARFEASSRGGIGGATYRIDEVMELVEMRTE